MKLFEVTALSMSPELQQYLKRLNISQSATLSPSGKLMVNGSVAIPRIDTSISFPFESVSGDFSCGATSIASLAGAPHTVGGTFSCSYTLITSLEHAPHTVDGAFFFNGTSITSLKGIHKTHRNWKIGRELYIPLNCADIVGLALIEGINTVCINGLRFSTSDHDPHMFQEQLLDAGLKTAARM